MISIDFEGTLVDFQWKLAEAKRETIHMLGKNGIPAGTLTGMNYSAIYNHIREKGDLGLPGGHLISMLDSIYDKYDQDAASRWKPIPGIHNILDKLGGYKLALVSNVGKIALYDVLSKFGLLERFGLIVSRSDVKMLKPSGEGIIKAMDWARSGRNSTIHVGDSLSDILAARSAGVKVAVVLGGEDSPEILVREKPDLLLDRLPDLHLWLKRLNV